MTIRKFILALFLLCATQAARAATMDITPNPVSVPPAGQTKTVNYQFHVNGLSSIDFSYGIHGVSGPTWNGDVPLFGTWNGTVFSASYDLPSDWPTGSYTYRAQSVGGAESVIGSLTVTSASGGCTNNDIDNAGGNWNFIGCGPIACGPSGLTCATGDHCASGICPNDGSTHYACAPDVGCNPPNQLPTISLDTGIQGQTFAPGSNITIRGTSADSDGTVLYVDLWENNNLLQRIPVNSAGGPWSFTWVNAPNNGLTVLKAFAVDDLGGNSPQSNVVTITINSAGCTDSDIDNAGGNWSFLGCGPIACGPGGLTCGSGEHCASGICPSDGSTHYACALDAGCNAPNQLPTISLDTNLNGQTFAPGSDITISGTSADSDGTVLYVDLWENNNLLQRIPVNSAGGPWSFTWVNAPNNGLTILKAFAVDDLGGNSPQSNVVTITITSAGCADSDIDNAGGNWSFLGCGPVACGPGGLTCASGEHCASGLCPNDGSTHYACALDAGCNAPNQLPTISLDTSLNGQTFAPGSDITIRGTSADSDGTVLYVDLWENNNLLQRIPVNSAGGPWSFTWTNVPNNGVTVLKAFAVDDLGGNSPQSNVVTITITSGGSGIGPTRSNPNPTGPLPIGTTSYVMSLETMEVANCRISQAPGTAYINMTDGFDVTDGTLHTVKLEPLTDGFGPWPLYIRCQDSLGNTNLDDLVIIIQVLGDAEPPQLSSPQPTAPLPAGTTSYDMSLQTNEVANCRISLTPGTAFIDMTSGFDVTNGTFHKVKLEPLTDGLGPIPFYIRCADSNGNANPNDFEIDISVLNPATPNNPVPVLNFLTPSSAVGGSQGFTLTVDGIDFVSGATVTWNGSDRPTTFISATQVTALISASDIALTATAFVNVANPSPGGGPATSALPFTIGFPPTPGLQKAYGVKVEADLGNLPAKSNTFTQQLCNTLSPSSCGASSALSWTILDNGGDVGDPGNNRRNDQGWLYADQFIEISNVDTNEPGWMIHIYTDNLASYDGPLVDKRNSPVQVTGAISGLVSTDGQFLVPLSWRLEPCVGGTCPVLDAAKIPPNAPPAEDFPDSPLELCSQRPQPIVRFRDSATHFIGDKNDVDTNPLNFLQKTWWESISDGCRAGLARNYQSVLNSDGAALSEFYRTPYSTLTGIGKYTLRVAAKLAPGTIKEKYQTTIFLELVRQ